MFTQNSTAIKETWAARLSNISNTFLPGERLLWSTKCSKCVINMFSFIQPLLFAPPIEPTGAPLIKFLLYLTLENTSKGGTEFPAAFMVHATVTN